MNYSITDIEKLFFHTIDAKNYVDDFNTDPSITITNIFDNFLNPDFAKRIKDVNKNKFVQIITNFAEEKAENIKWDTTTGLKAYGCKTATAINAIKKLEKFIPYFDEFESSVISIGVYDKKFAAILGRKSCDFNKSYTRGDQRWCADRRAAIKLLERYDIIRQVTSGVPGLICSLFAVNYNRIEEVRCLAKTSVDKVEDEPEEEIWKFTKVSPRHMASNLGRIKSLNYKNSGKPGILTAGINRGLSWAVPTLKVSICGKNYSVHRLVYEAFYGPVSDTAMIQHLDDNPENCALDNLVVIDNKETEEYQKRLDEAGQKSKDYWESRRIAKQIMEMGFFNN